MLDLQVLIARSPNMDGILTAMDTITKIGDGAPCMMQSRLDAARTIEASRVQPAEQIQAATRKHNNRSGMQLTIRPL